ncbi:MAG: hypothetical protein II350_07370, partial [Clostridia bacterium]|nr:hypothetical protein [Clostridia bacterium]
MAQKKSSKTVVRILFFVFLALFIFSGIMLIRSLSEYKKENKEQSRLEDEFLIFNEPDWDTTEPPTDPYFTIATTAGTLPNAETTAPVQTDAADGTTASTPPPFSGSPVSTEASAPITTAYTPATLPKEL